MAWPKNEEGIKNRLNLIIEDAQLDLAIGKNPVTPASFAHFLSDDDDDLSNNSNNNDAPKNRPR